ncbi:MAG: hypothetical protein V4447_00215 [Pseudomonadota bacterium]
MKLETASLYYVIRQGWAGAISPDVETLTGHALRRFTGFVVDNVVAWK